MLFNLEIERLPPPRLRARQNARPQVSICYQVAAARRGGLDEAEVRVELAEDLLRALQGTFAKKTKGTIGLSMQVMLGFGTLPRSEGGKLSRVQGLRTLA